MHNIIVFIGFILYKLRAIVSFLMRAYEKTLFHYFGKDTYLGHQCIFTHSSIDIGEHTYIGSKCVFRSAHGKILIGNHVMFGPGVHIHGGNHIMDRVGIYMDEARKEPGSDSNVIIEDDVWIGSNAIILGGGKEELKIGKGSVIGAGSIVTKSVPPYSVMVGSPARCIKMRFSEEQVQQHESLLYDN